MKPIEEFQQVRENLYFWSAFDPAVKADLSCCAIVTPAGLVLVDPLPLANEALEELTSLHAPSAIVLTNGNHQRDSARYASRFGVKIHAHTAARGEVTADEWMSGGASPLEGFDVIELPGFAPGEIALLAGGVLIVGDALIHLDPLGFSILPDKYCSDPKVGRASLRKLLPHSFEVLTFAHGAPLVVRAAARLQALLA